MPTSVSESYAISCTAAVAGFVPHAGHRGLLPELVELRTPVH